MTTKQKKQRDKYREEAQKSVQQEAKKMRYKKRSKAQLFKKTEIYKQEENRPFHK